MNQKQIIQGIYAQIENKCQAKRLDIDHVLTMADIGHNRRQTIEKHPDRIKLGELVGIANVLNIDLFNTNPIL